MSKFDLVIKGGTVIDGLQTPRYKADVAVAGGRVVRIGRVDASDGREVVDAAQRIVAPGFVDLHTHYDSQVFWDPWCTMSGWHGVTSVVIGNCGFGFAPCEPANRERAMLSLSRNEAVPLETMRVGMPWDWVTYPEFLDSVDRTPKGVNVMSFVPLAPLFSPCRRRGQRQGVPGHHRATRRDVPAPRRRDGGGRLRFQRSDLG